MNPETEELFSAIVKNQSDKILRICSVYADEEHRINDMYQEVLLNIWKSLPGFRGESKIETWLYRITLNICLKQKLKLEKEKKKFSSMDGIQMDRIYENTAGRKVQSERLYYCISKLKEPDKAVITLYLEGLKYKEIAFILGLTKNHVGVKISRIKTDLFHCLNRKSV